MLSGITGALLDLLFPQGCHGCGQAGAALALCAGCLEHSPPLTGPLCTTCGVPFASGRNHPCGRCLEHRPRFRRARACALYRSSDETHGALAAVIQRYKYGRDVALGAPLGALLRERCPYPAEYDVAVPVPLHVERLRWRGFNQALLLARPLARSWGIPVDPFALRRIRATPPQVGLDEEARRRNISRAFALGPGADVRGRAVLLVDDVYTTGATVNECARVLTAGGARYVDVLVLARAVAA